MLPGAQAKQLKNVQLNEKDMVKVEAIIQSMTKQERANPAIINGGRRRRIATGSGTTVQDVNRLLQQFEQSRKLMKQFAEMGKGKMPKFPF
jgi:signal recognition particle subunit SRP54